MPERPTDRSAPTSTLRHSLMLWWVRISLSAPAPGGSPPTGKHDCSIYSGRPFEPELVFGEDRGVARADQFVLGDDHPVAAFTGRFLKTAVRRRLMLCQPPATSKSGG